MGKKLRIMVVIIVAIAMVLCLVSCGGTDFAGQIKNLTDEMNKLKEENSSIKDKNDAQDGKLSDLEARLAKVEATIKGVSELDTRIGILEDNSLDTTLIAELRDDMTVVQASLLQNTTNYTALKASVTAMQLKLDEIVTNQSTNNSALIDTQDALNKLYGEIVRIYEFQQDNMYEVKLNGVLYYSIRIYYELHDTKIIDNPSDVTNCYFDELHVCGRIEIFNNTNIIFTDLTMKGLVLVKYNDGQSAHMTFVNKDNAGLQVGSSIKRGEKRQWYLNHYNKQADWKFETCSLYLSIPNTNNSVIGTVIHNYFKN